MSVDMKAIAVVVALLAGCATESQQQQQRPLPPGHKGAIVAAMQAIKMDVAGCFDRYHQTGMYSVAVTSAPDGTLQSVRVTGGEPETASCIEEVARRKLRMPPSEDGGPYSIVYPFILR
jgi:hypothetical protein